MGTYIIIAVLIGLLPAAIASKKGGSFLGWWFFGAVIFILALPLALMMKPQEDAVSRPCPHCRAMIPRQATACQHCTRQVEPLPANMWTVDCPTCGAANGIDKTATEWSCQACGAGWTRSVRSRLSR